MIPSTQLAVITWNPSRHAFTVPFLDVQVFWYSIFFALGLTGGYYICSKIILKYHCPSSITDQNRAQEWLDRLAIRVFVGILIGARLGHVIFYDFDHFFSRPQEIIMTWKGGLASHGGALGAFLALFFFWRKSPPPTFFNWKIFLDAAMIGSAWTATAIRIGNFFNQEILGVPTILPWGVIFGDPMDSPSVIGIPCHPVQLYEAAISLCLLLILVFIKNKSPLHRPGLVSGIYLVTLFSFRVLIEIIKLPQSTIDSTSVHMGQILSIPFIVFGIYLIHMSKNRKY